jgi:hypothetical protein
MGTAQIIWTALPNGFKHAGSTTILSLSVFVSPRLRVDGGQTGRLDGFRDFLDWPSHLQPDRFSLALIVDDDPAHPVPTRIVTTPQPDSVLWKALFDATTFVRTHAFEAPRQPVGSYDASAMAGTLYRGYGDIGQATPFARADREKLKQAFPHVYDALAPRDEPFTLDPTDVPGFSDSELASVHAALSDNLLRQDPGLSFDEKLAAAIAVAGRLAHRPDSRDAVPILPRTDDPASAIAQFAAFHRRHAPRTDATRAADPAPDPDAARIDFHQVLSTLGEYPDLLRRLGLAIDLEVDAAQVAESLFGHARRLRVAPSFTEAGVGGAPFTPSTRYVLDLRPTGSALPFALFAAAPRGAETPAGGSASVHDLEIVGGLLNLGLRRAEPPHAPQFSLVQVDLDGGIAKVLNALEAIVLEEQRPSHPIDRAEDAGAPAIRTSGVSLVRAGHGADLVRGMRRAEDHEAALRAADSTDLFAEDLVRGYRIDVRRFPADARFDGADPTPPTRWLSLHRRRGRFTFRHAATGPIVLENIGDEGFIQSAIVQDLASATRAAVDPLYTPESWFHWTGWNLSAPQIGTAVDLTPHTAAHAPGGTEGLPQVDVEFEAADASLPRLRFGHYYQVRARAVDLAGNGLSLDEGDAIVAALGAQGSPTPILFANPRMFRYRRFEPLPAPALVRRGALTEGESIDTMVIRSNGSSTAAYAASLGDPRYTAKNERHVAPPKAALSTIEGHGLLDDAVGASGNPGAFYALCKRESGVLPEQHADQQLAVPYLPDPLARGAAVFGLPGIKSDKTGQLDAQGALQWVPQKLAIPAWRVLGSVTEIDFGRRAQWPDFRPFRLILDELAIGAPSVQPVWDPQARTLTVRLAPGDTKTIWISTYPQESDIDMFGLHAWCREQSVPSDDEKHFLRMAAHGALQLISPPRRVRLVHAVQQPVSAPVATGNPLHTIRFERDTVAYIAGSFTLHVNSTEKVDLFAQWQEPDPSGGPRQTFNTHVFEVRLPPPATPADPAAPKPIATLDAFGRLDFQAPPEGTAAPAARYLARHEFGDTKHRKIVYQLAATTRFREYFPERLTSAEHLTRVLPIRNVVVLSSARPPAPEIAEIVPAFGWIVEGEVPNVTRSARRGGGLRVVLGPVWFSSGDGEQLAVVDVPRMGRWGLDPLHVSPAASTTGTVKPDVRPVSPPNSEFAGLIYPYDVQFDRDRSLWYCDLTFRIGDSYFPFKELTLARYQPQSLPGLHLSPLVHAGIHQLASDRLVTLAYATPAPGHADQRQVTITVSAIAVTSAARDQTAIAETPPAVEVTLEERPVSRQQWDDDLGWTVANAAQQPVADRPPSRTEPFSGHVRLPLSAGSTQRRLVIREYEVFPQNPANPAGQTWIGQAPTIARRVVYADTIRLD